jgi:hypothetical protein
VVELAGEKSPWPVLSTMQKRVSLNERPVDHGLLTYL